MTDLEWAVRGVDAAEEIPEPPESPEDELDPDEQEAEADGTQE